MATYKTRGIILKRQNFHEADRILTIYTEDHGKVKIIAKGVRKLLSRLGGHLEPFYLVNLVVAEGRNIDVLTGVTIENHFLDMRDDLKNMARAYCMGEAVDALTNEREENEEIFRLIWESLEYLEHHPEQQVLDEYFQINLLNLLGYRPELYECVHCRKKIEPDEITWDHEHGGVLCERCNHQGLRVSAEAIKVLRILLARNIRVLSRLSVGDKLEEEVDKIIGDFLKYLLQRELISENFIKKVQGER